MPDSRSGDAGSKARTVAEFPARSTIHLARLILILGTPGVGKSTLAKGLAAKLGFQTVDIGALVRREKLYKRFDTATKSYVIDEVPVARRLQNLLSEKDLIVSTHSIGRTVVPGWVNLALVLRLDPLVLYRRLRAKRWTRSKAWENAESELVDVCLFEAVRMLGQEKVFEIDTTSKPPSRVLLESLRILRDKSQVPGFRVNWLKTYDPVDLERRLLWKSSS